MLEMEDYQIISRKYRPQNFTDVVGQEAIVQTLTNALKMGRVAQAYLFCGSKGTGKTTLARILAKALNCQNLQNGYNPCNQCTSCTEIALSRSLDVMEIDGASNRGIDDIRELNETVGYAAVSGKYKIYIIDEVHMLTKEAFNALLKTLEEPPRNTKFFFATTEPHKVLATIASRCQRFELRRLSNSAIQEKLKKILGDMRIQIEADALSLLSQLAEGSLRDAESLLDQLICFGHNPITLDLIQRSLGLPEYSDLFGLDGAIAESKLDFAFECTQKLFESGKELTLFVDTLLHHFRNHLLLKLKKEATFLPEDLKEPYINHGRHYTQEQCLYILDLLLEWQPHFMKSASKKTHLEMILISLIRSRNRVTLDSLVRRLTELEQPTPEKQVQRYDLKIEARQEEMEARAAVAIKENPFHSQEEVLQKKVPSSRLDTLVRFAAVELEGTIKN